MGYEMFITIFAGCVLATVTGGVGFLWVKVDKTMPRKEVTEIVARIERSMERLADALNRHAEEDRDSMKQLFANAESDRAQTNGRFISAFDRLHDSHVALLSEVHKAAEAANAASSAAAAVLSRKA